MTEEIDIWRTAQLLVKQHGNEATTHAAMRADELLDEGDLDGASVWRRILKAIEQIRDTGSSGPDKTVH